MSLETDLVRSRPPAPGTPRGFRFPSFERSRLDNGLEVLAARFDRLPLVSLELLASAGAQYDGSESDPARPGLANLHGELIDEGTSNRSSLEVATAVESLGGSLSSGVDWNVAYVGLGLMTRHLGPGLEILAEIARAPSFAPAEVERVRGELLANILRRQGQPASLAERTFAAAVYGGTVYGHPLIGTARSVEALERDDVVDFYRRHVTPGGSTLIAVGDLEPEALIARAEMVFGDWPAGPAAERPRIEPRPLAATEVHLVDRPGSAQTHLHLGHAGVPREHPDYHRLMVMNAIFGGKFTSRINLNLRERHGYTYGANSFFVRRQGPGPFLIRTAVANGVVGAAVGELISEMRRIRDEPVSADELLDTQRYLIGVFPYTLQTVSDLARRLEALVVFGLPDDYYRGFPAVLADVTRDDVLEAARAHLHPDRLAIVAVGPADELRAQLEPLGPVHLHSSEEDAESSRFEAGA